METFYNWNQIRGLAFLAILGLFVMYALLVASLQNWHVKRRARRMTEQDSPLSAKPAMASGGSRSAAEPHTWLDERSASDSSRRAA